MSFPTRNRLPMKTLILNHLIAHGDISGIEASAMWACRDLPKRISELKKDGWPVATEYKQDGMGQRYARYTFAPTAGSTPTPAEAQSRWAASSLARQQQMFQNKVDA